MTEESLTYSANDERGTEPHSGVYHPPKMSCGDETEQNREYNGCRKARYIVPEIHSVVCIECGHDGRGFGENPTSKRGGVSNKFIIQ